MSDQDTERRVLELVNAQIGCFYVKDFTELCSFYDIQAEILPYENEAHIMLMRGYPTLFELPVAQGVRA